MPDKPVIPVFPISQQDARDYRDAGAALVAHVNERIAAHPDLARWLGPNDFRLLEDNHRNHHALMSTVFVFSQYSLLLDIVPWVYRAYHARALDWDYFPAAFAAWTNALDAALPANAASAIRPVYEWLIAAHKQFIELSLQPPEPSGTGTGPQPWAGIQDSFLDALLDGNAQQAIERVMPFVRQPSDLEPLYLHLIAPVMHHIGQLWETGQITVAQEHLASAIVGRLMAGFSTFRFQTARKPFRALISAAPNEFHEIGAWMVSDLLELDGWQVRYLGANTPERDLLEMLDSFQPHVLALSVTMPFHVPRALEFTKKLRSSKRFPDLRIMVGGAGAGAFQENLQAAGVDATAADAAAAVRLADSWVQA